MSNIKVTILHVEFFRAPNWIQKYAIFLGPKELDEKNFKSPGH